MKDKKTLQLIDESIQKWTDIVAGRIVDQGPVNCPLCKEFKFKDLKESEPKCKLCPIRKYTNEGYCDNPHMMRGMHTGEGKKVEKQEE